MSMVLFTEKRDGLGSSNCAMSRHFAAGASLRSFTRSWATSWYVIIFLRALICPMYVAVELVAKKFGDIMIFNDVYFVHLNEAYGTDLFKRLRVFQQTLYCFLKGCFALQNYIRDVPSFAKRDCLN